MRLQQRLLYGWKREGRGWSIAKGVGRNETCETFTKIDVREGVIVSFFLVFFWCVFILWPMYWWLYLFYILFPRFFLPFGGRERKTVGSRRRRAGRLFEVTGSIRLGGGGQHFASFFFCTRAFVDFFSLSLVLSRPWRDRGRHVTTKLLARLLL